MILIYEKKQHINVDKTIKESKTFKNLGEWTKFLIPISYLKLAIFNIYKYF